MLRRMLPLLFILPALESSHASDRFRALLPTDEQAGRYGLVRRWYGFAPIDGVHEEVERAMVVGDQIHLHTNRSRIHVMHGESGKLLWSAQLGRPSPAQMGSSINSNSVFVIAGSWLYRLDRETGSEIWSLRLLQVPSAAPGADDAQVVASTADGRIYVYNVDTREVIWFYQMNAPVSMPVVFLDDKIACASEDGMLYVFQPTSRNPQLRYTTGARISAPLATWGRTILVPSRDYSVYAVDVRTGETLWRYTSGAEIHRAVSIIENDAFITPEDLGIHCVDVTTGLRKWWHPRGRHFLSSSARRVYAMDAYGQLMILDRSTGRLVNLWDRHEFDLRVRNESNDRLYLVTRTGLVVCLHERENVEPVQHFKTEAPPAEDQPLPPGSGADAP